MLEVKNLSIHFEDDFNEVVQEVSFTVQSNEIVGLVGESGSGKTITALTIAGLKKPGQIIRSGKIYLDGLELLSLSNKEIRKIQGREVGFIFQEPMTALNPTMKIGKQVEEALILHTTLNKRQRKEKALKALQEVELKEVDSLYNKFPGELSGGMRQRVMIAAAMICKPKLLLADEPTTALDLTTQDEILKLVEKLAKNYGASILFISHNLKVVKELCSRVLVMKDGVIVEAGETNEIFDNPKHEYTRELIKAIPAKADIDIISYI
jgi:peptide/nickel transport system ATP-binding protein